MSDFHNVHPTGLLYKFMHNMPIFEGNVMKFGKHVLCLYVTTFATLNL